MSKMVHIPLGSIEIPRDKRASDPLLTIQLQESTIQKLRNITLNGISGFNPDKTYNMIVNHILSTAEIKEQ
jgi:hypothetical protein